MIVDYFVTEIIGLLYTPWILLYLLPSRIDAITNFHYEHYNNIIPKVGRICTFSDFEGNEVYNSEKMQMSICNFKINNHVWNDMQNDLKFKTHKRQQEYFENL